MLTGTIIVKEETLLFLSDRSLEKRARAKRRYARCFILNCLSCFEVASFSAFVDACVEDAKPREANFPSCRELLPDMGEQVIEDFVIELL